MSLSELLRSGLIEKFDSDEAQIRNEAEIARSEVASANSRVMICSVENGLPLSLAGSLFTIQIARLKSPSGPL